MKKQVIIYVDVPDNLPALVDSLNDAIEQEVADLLPDLIYVTRDTEDEDDELEVALDWGGVTVRDA